MQSVIKLALVLVLVVSSALAMAAREVKTQDFSGWMKNYDSLTYNERRNAFLFFNEAKRGTYNKVILEEVVIYSKDGEADTEIAGKATSYLSQGLADLLKSKGLAASEPGPGILRVKLAITGAEKSAEDLKAYNFVPVAAVFRGAQAATGDELSFDDVKPTLDKWIAQYDKTLDAFLAKR